MITRVRRHLTYANVVATLALLCALGGGGTALALVITGADVKNDSLTGYDIKNESLTSADIDNGSVGRNDIAAGAIVTSRLADGAVTAPKLAAASVFTPALADAAVTASKLAAGAVTSDAIGTGAITSNALADDSVTGSALADDSVGSGEVTDGSIERDDLSSNARSPWVTFSYLADDVVVDTSDMTTVHTIALPSGGSYMYNVFVRYIGAAGATRLHCRLEHPIFGGLIEGFLPVQQQTLGLGFSQTPPITLPGAATLSLMCGSTGAAVTISYVNITALQYFAGSNGNP